MTNGETVDILRGFDLRIIQPREGYRFSLDPLILCNFAEVQERQQVLDLGTGCGIIPLVLTRNCISATVVGVDIQEDMAELAQRNVLLNGLADRIEIIETDVISLRERFAVSSFDLIVANPPYRRAGSGRISPKAGRDKGRHETSAGLSDFLKIAKYLVRPGGRICFIYHVSRLPELFIEALLLKLAPLRLQVVHGSQRAAARMVLLELAKGRRGELEVLPPLFVYDTEGNYSKEMKRILGERDA